VAAPYSVETVESSVLTRNQYGVLDADVATGWPLTTTREKADHTMASALVDNEKEKKKTGREEISYHHMLITLCDELLYIL
jgi:hypothetical protein